MQNEVEKMDMNAMAHLILKAVALAMGIGVAVLSVLNQIDIRSNRNVRNRTCLPGNGFNYKERVSINFCVAILVARLASWTRRISRSGFFIFV